MACSRSRRCMFFVALIMIAMLSAYLSGCEQRDGGTLLSVFVESSYSLNNSNSDESNERSESMSSSAGDESDDFSGSSSSSEVQTTPVPTSTPSPNPTSGATIKKLTSATGIEILQPDSGLMEFDPTIFGLSTTSKDNTDAFNLALYFCKENPDSKMVIPKGRYVFNNAAKLKAYNLENVIIDGQGAEFIFQNTGFFEIRYCETLLIKDLVIDWDWDHSRPANLLKVKDKGLNYVDLEFVEVDNINLEDVTFYTLNQFDSETLTPGTANGMEFWEGSVTPTRTEKVANNVIRAYGMQAQYSLQVGTYYLQRNFACISHAFDTTESHNVTFSGLKVYSAPGMAFVFGIESSHIFIDHCFVGIRPGEEDKRHISTQADGLHCLNTGGNIWVEGCDFSYMGDDAINIHDNVGVILDVLSSKSVLVQNNLLCEVGDTICFLSDDYTPIGFTAKITDKAPGSNNSWRLEFDKELTRDVKVNGIVYNTKFDSSKYYIHDSYFHCNRARGILAQASDGVIEDCRFYRIQGAAIRVVTEIASGLWSEGTGVDTLVVRNNTFDRCNVNDWSALIDIRTHVFGAAVETKIMKNLLFENNTFKDFPSDLFYICSAKDVIIRNNIIQNPTFLVNGKTNRGRIFIEMSENVAVENNQYDDSPYMSENVGTPVWIR